MSKDNAEIRMLTLMAILALWFAVYGYSIIFFMTHGPTSERPAGGLNRITGFLGWQGVAGMLAFASWGIGWSFPKDSGIRRISAMPLGLALLLVLAVLGIAMFGG